MSFSHDIRNMASLMEEGWFGNKTPDPYKEKNRLLDKLKVETEQYLSKDVLHGSDKFKVYVSYAPTGLAKKITPGSHTAKLSIHGEGRELSILKLYGDGSWRIFINNDNLPEAEGEETNPEEISNAWHRSLLKNFNY